MNNKKQEMAGKMAKKMNNQTHYSGGQFKGQKRERWATYGRKENKDINILKK